MRVEGIELPSLPSMTLNSAPNIFIMTIMVIHAKDNMWLITPASVCHGVNSLKWMWRMVAWW